MRRGEQRNVGHQVLDQIPAQPLFLIRLDDEQRHHRDQRGEPEQQQFGVAPVGHWRHDGDRGLRLGAHDAARQVVPGSCGGGGNAVTVGDGVGGGGGGAGAVNVVGVSGSPDGGGGGAADSLGVGGGGGGGAFVV